MKAFKLASAFAVTGLALAISGQAMAADTTTDWTWDGEVTFSADLMNNNTGADNTLLGKAVAGKRGANDLSFDALNVAIDVANGGFSATLEITASSSSNYDGAITVSDFMYEEGAISFGDIGNLNTTEGYISGMADDQYYTADRALRYTMDNGFAVQAFGGVTTTDDKALATTLANFQAGVDMGVEVAYAGEFEGGSFAVDAQYAEDPNSTSGDDAHPMYMGVGVTMAASDAVEVKAAYTTGFDEVASYGVRADYTADAFTAYGSYTSDSDVATTAIGGTATMGAIELYVDYTMEDAVDAVLDLGASTAGASGAMSYTASLDLADVTGANTYEAAVGVAFAASDMLEYSASYLTRNGDSSEMKAGATYTTEGGATLALAYEKDDGNGTDDDDGDVNDDSLTLTASYSF